MELLLRRSHTRRDTQGQCGGLQQVEDLVYDTHGQIPGITNSLSGCRYRLRPRVLRDVSKLDMSVSLLGEKVAFPICVAPTALQRMAHNEGELATARDIRISWGLCYKCPCMFHHSVCEILAKFS